MVRASQSAGFSLPAITSLCGFSRGARIRYMWGKAVSLTPVLFPFSGVPDRQAALCARGLPWACRLCQEHDHRSSAGTAELRQLAICKPRLHVLQLPTCRGHPIAASRAATCLVACRWMELSWLSQPLMAPCHRRGNTSSWHARHASFTSCLVSWSSCKDFPV